MAHIEIQDAPLGQHRRVVLDGHDITPLLKGFTVTHEGAEQRGPAVSLTMVSGAVRGSITVDTDDDNVYVSEDFPDELVKLLHQAGWLREAEITAATTTRAVLDSLMTRIVEVNKRNGWFDTNRSMGDDMALLASEVSEAYEAYRKQQMDEYDDPQLSDVPQYNPSSFPAELADILIRLLDTCYRYNVDLAGATERKLDYNSRREYRHGNKVV